MILKLRDEYPNPAPLSGPEPGFLVVVALKRLQPLEKRTRPGKTYLYCNSSKESSIYINSIPLRVIHRYNGELAHKMFLTTLETTTRVYVQVWGPKETCHDTLEPIRAGGRGPRGPGGPPGGPRAERSFAKNKKCCNIFQKDFLKSTVTQSINTENKGSNPSVSKLFCSPFSSRICRLLFEGP